VTDWLRNVPRLIPLCCMAITIAGLFGLHRADQLYGESRMFERQLIWICLAWPAMFMVTWIPWRRFRHWGPALFAVCLVLLVVVLFLPPINGSRRWIPLGLMDFQPSEPARLAFIMALASWLMYRENLRTIQGLVVPFIVTLLPLLLVLREPDLGTAMLFLPILYAMLFAAGAKTKHLFAATMMGICLLPLLWQQMTSEQRSRVVMLMNQKDGGPAPPGDGFHLHQAKQILALGGPGGSIHRDGPIIDDPTAMRLPAARTDFILTMIGERYGLAGVAFVFLMYGVLVWKGLRAASATQDPWGRLVAVGIVTMIGVQTIINSSMTVGLMPITGMTLPFCSYGGSSLLSFSVAVGLLMNIAMRPGYDVGPAPFGQSRR
jgi:cell division protein FtsW (lipid II flippase)